MSSTTPGRDWLSMGPQHFDADLLPRKHRKPQAEGLFPVADAVPSPPRPAKPRPRELDGQMDMLALLEE